MHLICAQCAVLWLDLAGAEVCVAVASLMLNGAGRRERWYDVKF